jgi:hypothetical protein
VRVGRHLVQGSTTPEEGAHVEATCVRSIQRVEEASPSIRQLERRIEKRHGHPDAVLGRINAFTDPLERRLAVDERPYPVSSPNRIATGLGERNVLSRPVHLKAPFDSANSISEASLMATGNDDLSDHWASDGPQADPHSGTGLVAVSFGWLQTTESGA